MYRGKNNQRVYGQSLHRSDFKQSRLPVLAVIVALLCPRYAFALIPSGGVKNSNNVDHKFRRDLGIVAHQCNMTDAWGGRCIEGQRDQISIDIKYPESNMEEIVSEYFQGLKIKGELINGWNQFLHKLDDDLWCSIHNRGWVKYGVNYLTSPEFFDQLSDEEKEGMHIKFCEMHTIPSHIRSKFQLQTLAYYFSLNLKFDQIKDMIFEDIRKELNHIEEISNPKRVGTDNDGFSEESLEYVFKYLKNFGCSPIKLQMLGYPVSLMDEYVIDKINVHDLVGKSNTNRENPLLSFDIKIFDKDAAKMLTWVDLTDGKIVQRCEHSNCAALVAFDKGGSYNVAKKIMLKMPNLWGYLNAIKIGDAPQIMDIIKMIISYKEKEPFKSESFDGIVDQHYFHDIIFWIIKEINQIKSKVLYNLNTLIKQIDDSIKDSSLITEFSNLMIDEEGKKFRDVLRRFIFIKTFDGSDKQSQFIKKNTLRKATCQVAETEDKVEILEKLIGEGENFWGVGVDEAEILSMVICGDENFHFSSIDELQDIGCPEGFIKNFIFHNLKRISSDKTKSDEALRQEMNKVLFYSDGTAVSQNFRIEKFILNEFPKFWKFIDFTNNSMVTELIINQYKNGNLTIDNPFERPDKKVTYFDRLIQNLIKLDECFELMNQKIESLVDRKSTLKKILIMLKKERYLIESKFSDDISNVSHRSESISIFGDTDFEKYYISRLLDTYTTKLSAYSTVEFQKAGLPYEILIKIMHKRLENIKGDSKMEDADKESAAAALIIDPKTKKFLNILAIQKSKPSEIKHFVVDFLSKFPQLWWVFKYRFVKELMQKSKSSEINNYLVINDVFLGFNCNKGYPRLNELMKVDASKFRDKRGWEAYVAKDMKIVLKTFSGYNDYRDRWENSYEIGLTYDIGGLENRLHYLNYIITNYTRLSMFPKIKDAIIMNFPFEMDTVKTWLESSSNGSFPDTFTVNLKNKRFSIDLADNFFKNLMAIKEDRYDKLRNKQNQHTINLLIVMGLGSFWVYEAIKKSLKESVGKETQGLEKLIHKNDELVHIKNDNKQKNELDLEPEHISLSQSIFDAYLVLEPFSGKLNKAKRRILNYINRIECLMWHNAEAESLNNIDDQISKLELNIKELEDLVYKILRLKYDRERAVDPENTIINCPITLSLFKHPVINSTGSTYSKEPYLKYMRGRLNLQDPKTFNVIEQSMRLVTVDNRPMQKLINEVNSEG